MNTSNRNPAATTAPKKRFGLMRVKVESNHLVRMNGLKHQVRARDISRFPDAKTVYVCTWCRDHGIEKSQYASENDLLAAHPTKAQMAKQEEAHVYFAWSNDVEPGAKLDELNEQLDTKVRAIESAGGAKDEVARQVAAAKAEHTRKLGLLPRIGMLTEEDVE
jgi:hypothetical protein